MTDLKEEDPDVSSSSSDDEDYVPPEDAENDVDDEGYELDNFKEELSDLVDKAKSTDTESRAKNENKEGDEENELEKQKRADELFKAFLADIDEPTTSACPPTVPATSLKRKAVDLLSVPINKKRAHSNDIPDPFAETEEEGSNHGDAEVAESGDAADIKIQSEKSSDFKRPAVGLDNALNLISKKSRTSVLDKSQEEWIDFKSQEGIEEELNTHNRGKNGYLEKVEFLTRTDFRQFVNEREARAARRNK